MRAIDTNVLLRLVTGDDPVQCRTSEDFVEKGAWVSVLVFAETVWTLASKYGHDVSGVEQAVKMLLSHDRIVLQDADAISEALELFSHRPSLGFSDCLILALARKHGHLPLGTFDRNLGKLPGAQRL